jgi:hypothetical protein
MADDMSSAPQAPELPPAEVADGITIETSDEIGEIAKAIAAAQAQLDNVSKNSVNPHFKSKYADLAAAADAARPAFAAAGVAIIQAPTTKGHLVRITTLFAHGSGQWIRSTLGMKPTKTDPQGVGAAITYARRYSLLAMTGLAPEEDDDANRASKRPVEARNAMEPERGPRTKSDGTQQNPSQARKDGDYEKLQAELRAVKDPELLSAWWDRNEDRIARLPPKWQDHLQATYDEHHDDIKVPFR